MQPEKAPPCPPKNIAVKSRTTKKRQEEVLTDSNSEHDLPSTSKPRQKQKKMKKLKKPIGSFFMGAIDGSDLDDIKVSMSNDGESSENEKFEGFQTQTQESSSDEELEIPDIDSSSSSDHVSYIPSFLLEQLFLIPILYPYFFKQFFKVLILFFRKGPPDMTNSCKKMLQERG